MGLTCTEKKTPKWRKKKKGTEKLYDLKIKMQGECINGRKKEGGMQEEAR